MSWENQILNDLIIYNNRTIKGYGKFYYLQKLCMEEQGIGGFSIVITFLVQVTELVQIPEMIKHRCVLKASQNNLC